MESSPPCGPEIDSYGRETHYSAELLQLGLSWQEKVDKHGSYGENFANTARELIAADDNDDEFQPCKPFPSSSFSLPSSSRLTRTLESTISNNAQLPTLSGDSFGISGRKRGVPGPGSAMNHIPTANSRPNAEKIPRNSFRSNHQGPSSSSQPPSPAMDLAGHLYASFLQGHTADVILRVAGTWSAIYRLHRVVLIQAGFFQSLFTSGFEEATSERKEIEIVFDDTNITRAAFEVCISRLYGGGPPLYIYPELVPTPTKPFTPAFPFGPPLMNTAPDKHQPASPKFLLSLLATSLYLEIPSIASHALSSVLATIGPYTVIDYLNFARGKPISDGSPELSVSAVGLERVAEVTGYHSETVDSMDDAVSLSSISTRGPACSSLKFYYGAISDKIGEACACWLARWGPDMFTYEEATHNSSTQPTSRRRADTLPADTRNRDNAPDIPSIFSSFRPGHGLSPQWIRALLTSDSLFVNDEMARYTLAKRIVELRRRLRKSYREPTISVKGKGKETQLHGEEELPDEHVEEREWQLLFETGVYYSNLTPTDLISISTDISSSTGCPYVPLSVLQSANWEHSSLRHIVSSAKNSDKLGAGTSGPEVYVAYMRTGQSDTKHYYLVPHDESLRIGDTINTPGAALSESNIHNNISMDQLFQRSFSPHAKSTSGSQNTTDREDLPTTSNERTFFGLLPDTLDTLIRHSPLPPREPDSTTASGKVPGPFSPLRVYTTYPPFRFSVEFWDLEMLKEKQRLYSQTVWYAGSLFNIYVQVVKKNSKDTTNAGSTRERNGSTSGAGEMQLGIYLHRQSTVEAIPTKSAPSPAISRAEGVVPVADLREGESVLIGTSSIPIARPNSPPSPQSDSPRRENISTSGSGSGSGWLRSHVRGPSRGSSPPGTPLSLTLTRSRTPINNTNTTFRRPATASSISPSSSVGLSSSLPSEPLNIQSLSISHTRPSTADSNVVPTSSVQLHGGYTSSTAPYAVSSPPPAQQPYRDPRQVVSVYFSVYCASPTGNGQTRFRSGPDVFKIGQSWGWKSGGLLGNSSTSSGGRHGGNGSGHGGSGSGSIGNMAAVRSALTTTAGGSTVTHPVKEEGGWALIGKEVSLRATVILGVV